jgi:hypothetical protein
MIRHRHMHISATRQIAFARGLLCMPFEHFPNDFIVGKVLLEPILQ